MWKKHKGTHTHATTLSDLARIKEASIRKEDLARYPVLIHADEMLSNAFFPPVPPKTWCISISFPSLNTNSRSCLTIPALRERWDFAQRGPRSTVHSHTYSSKQRYTSQSCAGCCPCCAHRLGEVRCRKSPVSSPHCRDWCKAQFLNRCTKIEIVCCLNDILLFFQMLQPGQLIPHGNTSASHLLLSLWAAWSPGCSLHRSKYHALYQRITTENLLRSNSPISAKFHPKSWTVHCCNSLWDPDL